MRPFPDSLPLADSPDEPVGRPPSAWLHASQAEPAERPDGAAYRALLAWLGSTEHPLRIEQVVDIDADGAVRGWLGAHGADASDLLSLAELARLPGAPSASPPASPSTPAPIPVQLGARLRKPAFGGTAIVRELVPLARWVEGLRLVARYWSFAAGPEAAALVDARRENARRPLAPCCDESNRVVAAEQYLVGIPATLEVIPAHPLRIAERMHLEETLAVAFGESAVTGGAVHPALLRRSDAEVLLGLLADRAPERVHAPTVFP